MRWLILLPTILLSAQQPEAFQAVGVDVSKIEYKGAACLRVTAKPGLPGTDETLALWKSSQFRDGVIEAEVASELGKDASATARGFIGIAFRVQPDGKDYEAFYLRPTNARADDQVRRNHSVQYISHPDFTWQRLRKEFPEKYESYTDMVAGEWTRIRIEVKGKTARLYVNGAAQPSLIVNDLKSNAAEGAIALWIGPGTVGYFRNLQTKP